MDYDNAAAREPPPLLLRHRAGEEGAVVPLITAPPAVVEMTLPFPPSELSPNSRPDPHEKREIQRAYKQSCFTDARNARLTYEGQGVAFPLAAPVTAIVTFVLTERQRRDFDNLLSAFKHGLDGIVQAKVLRDDNVWDLRLGLDVALGAKSEVRLRLEAAAG